MTVSTGIYCIQCSIPHEIWKFRVFYPSGAISLGFCSSSNEKVSYRYKKYRSANQTTISWANFPLGHGTLILGKAGKENLSDDNWPDNR